MTTKLAIVVSMIESLPEPLQEKVADHLREYIQKIKNETSEQPESENDLPPKLSNPARRALANAGCSTLAQVAEFSEAEVKKWHGIGPSGIALLRLAMSAKGLSFAEKAKVSTTK